jgi:hypothetical protein
MKSVTIRIICFAPEKIFSFTLSKYLKPVSYRKTFRSLVKYSSVLGNRNPCRKTVLSVNCDKFRMKWHSRVMTEKSVFQKLLTNLLTAVQYNIWVFTAVKLASFCSCVFLKAITDVSVKHIAPICTVKEYYISSTLKMEAIYSSETTVITSSANLRQNTAIILMNLSYFYWLINP